MTQSMAKHTYDNWVIDPDTGEVGIIQADMPKMRVQVKWQNGKITEGPFCYDLITEYEFYKIIDPKRCGADLPDLIAAFREGMQEDFFTGGVYRNSIVKQKKEDFFG